MTPILAPKHSRSSTNETGLWPQAIITALATLPATGRIPAAALVNLRDRFAGKLVDVEAVLGAGAGALDLAACRFVQR